MADVQFWPAAAVGNNGTPNTIVPWASQAYPSGASPASITALGVVATNFAGSSTRSTIGGTHAVFLWTSTQNLGLVNVGAQIVVGQIFRVPVDSTDLEIVIRLKTSETDRFSEIFWELHSVANTSDSFSDLITLTDNTWQEEEITNLGISGWDPTMEVVLTLNAKGTTNPANVGATGPYVE